jgi:hypothetical protein
LVNERYKKCSSLNEIFGFKVLKTYPFFRFYKNCSRFTSIFWRKQHCMSWWCTCKSVYLLRLIHSKNHIADFTFLVCRINVNRHTPLAYVFLLWFHDSDHWFYVSGVFYLNNNILVRPRFAPATARNTFQHKNTTPYPCVLGYSTSWKSCHQLPISIIFWIWSISRDVRSMFWLT